MTKKNYSREEVIEILKFVNENFEVRAKNGFWYKTSEESFYSNERVIGEFEGSKLEKKSKVN